tara:strand:- start:4239 stop:4661 length:423 start_codon:yes stop_codon:yes gene_type:complete
MTEKKSIQVFLGSCLCGKVKYKITGSAFAFYHCHCMRCRKLSGTGHASNIRLDSANIEWLSGAQLIKTYNVPEAERFRNDFCGDCGSPLPRLFIETGLVVLPAGTLDHEPACSPESRIFYASRSDWSCSDELPVHDEYPK